MNKEEILSRQLDREKKARKKAEDIAETKSRALYKANMELQNLTTELINKEEKTRAIIEATGEGILVLDKNFDIESCNQTASELFNLSSENLLGKNFFSLIDTTSHVKFRNAFNTITNKKKQNVLFETNIIPSKQQKIPVEIVISKMQIAKNISLICAIRNILKRKLLEQRAAARHELSRILAEYSSLDEITPKILKIIGETLHLVEGNFWKVEHDKIRCVDSWCIEDKKIQKFAEISKQTIFEKGNGLPGQIWQSKKASWIQEVSLDPHFPRGQSARTAGLHSAFAFPVLFEGMVLAVVEFFSRTTSSVDENLMAMLNDISKQIGIFIEREQALKRVALLSRQTGMADVAASVLHNVGNALNSINVSIEMLNRQVTQSKMENLSLLANLLEKHKHDISHFLANDPQGTHVVEFISLLSSEWKNEKQNLNTEINSLQKNVGHVKDIVMMQQSISHISGISEITSVIEIIEDALILNEASSQQRKVEIIREFLPAKKIITDRIKLLQIMMNLTKNALDALHEHTIEIKKMTIRVKEKDDKHLMIQVIDNGIGILPENIKHIFTHGFTTKKFGHGYGLHNSAIFAKEIGGTLSVESDGVGKGSTFTLILPYEYTRKGKPHEY